MAKKQRFELRRVGVFRIFDKEFGEYRSIEHVVDLLNAKYEYEQPTYRFDEWDTNHIYGETPECEHGYYLKNGLPYDSFNGLPASASISFFVEKQFYIIRDIVH